MIQAIVAVLPVPVAPSSVWYCSPARRLAESCSIACGWSPVGSYATAVLNGSRHCDRLAAVARKLAALFGREACARSREPHLGEADELVQRPAEVAGPLRGPCRPGQPSRSAGRSTNLATQVGDPCRGDTCGSRPSFDRQRPAVNGPAVTTQRPSGLNSASLTPLIVADEEWHRARFSHPRSGRRRPGSRSRGARPRVEVHGGRPA